MHQQRITLAKRAVRKPMLSQSLDEEYASKLRFAARLIGQLRAAGLECEMSSEMPAQKL